MSAEDFVSRIEKMLAPICEELALELYDVEVKPSSDEGLVRVTLERAAASGPGTGISIGEIGEVTRQLDYLLDVEDFIPFTYRLEVSSPGIERELTRPGHYERHMNDEVRMVLRQATSDGQNVLRGKLVGYDGISVTVACEDGVTRETTLDAIKKARTVYDFDAVTPKPKQGKGAKRNNDSGTTGES